MLSHLGSSLEEVKEESDIGVASTENDIIKSQSVIGQV